MTHIQNLEKLRTEHQAQHPWLEELDEHTWIISDTHFNHARIMSYEPTRVDAMAEQGFTGEGAMNDWMIANWNARVAANDLVLHLGDFAFKHIRPFINQLNGRIILLLGNHDIPLLTHLQAFAKSHPNKLYIHQGCERVNAPAEVSGIIKTIAGVNLMFSHYPLISRDPYLRGRAAITRDAMASVFKQQACDFCIHGHVHSNDSGLDAREINVSMERTGFAPVRLGSVLEGLSSS
jgi:calcineurin-like phosphoesterase family protein